MGVPHSAVAAKTIVDAFVGHQLARIEEAARVRPFGCNANTQENDHGVNTE
jgi:hypothetical protein